MIESFFGEEGICFYGSVIFRIEKSVKSFLNEFLCFYLKWRIIYIGCREVLIIDRFVY